MLFPDILLTSVAIGVRAFSGRVQIFDREFELGSGADVWRRRR